MTDNNHRFIKQFQAIGFTLLASLFTGVVNADDAQQLSNPTGQDQTITNQEQRQINRDINQDQRQLNRDINQEQRQINQDINQDQRQLGGRGR